MFWLIVRPKFLHFLSVSSTRPRLLVALATVVALAIGGTVAGYAALTTSYQLTLDGKTREVSSTGDTVAEVLASEGVEVTEHDLVAPELDEPVTEGSRIVVRFGRPVELHGRRRDQHALGHLHRRDERPGRARHAVRPRRDLHLPQRRPSAATAWPSRS